MIKLSSHSDAIINSYVISIIPLIQAWKFKYWINDDTHRMVTSVMKRYNLVWRDRGSRTKKTFLDKIAKYAVGKVRKNLMPNFFQIVTKNLKR